MKYRQRLKAFVLLYDDGEDFVESAEVFQVKDFVLKFYGANVLLYDDGENFVESAELF